ncbi:MAG: hypothetical protein VW270_28130 [Candidatus Poseidoniales archaeon]
MSLFTTKTDSDELELYASCCCNCPSHVIKISHYPNEDELWVSFIISPQTLTEKVRAIWNILFSGGATTHEVLLNDRTWTELAGKLAQHAMNQTSAEGEGGQE